jgi:hypothetical protein
MCNLCTVILYVYGFNTWNIVRTDKLDTVYNELEGLMCCFSYS